MKNIDKNLTKQWISIYIIVVMLITMMPMPIYAEDGGENQTNEIDIDENNFPDRKFREELVNSLDKDGNGKLSDNEITVSTYPLTLNFETTNTKGVELLKLVKPDGNNSARICINAPSDTNFPFTIFDNIKNSKGYIGSICIAATDDNMMDLSAINIMSSRIGELEIKINSKTGSIDLSKIANANIDNLTITGSNEYCKEDMNKVVNLPEIEGFEKLDKVNELKISGPLLAIDFLDLGNTKFKDIDINGDLKKLNVKNCMNLEKLHISGEMYNEWSSGYNVLKYASITELDLRDLVSLKDVKITHTKLNNLMINKDFHFNFFEVYDNALTHIESWTDSQLNRFELSNNRNNYQKAVLPLKKENNKYFFDIKEAVGKDRIEQISVYSKGHEINYEKGIIEIEDPLKLEEYPVKYDYISDDEWHRVLLSVELRPEKIINISDSPVKELKLKETPVTKKGINPNKLVVTLVKEDGSEEDVKYSQFKSKAIDINGHFSLEKITLTHMPSKKSLVLYLDTSKPMIEIIVEGGKGSGKYYCDEKVEISANVSEDREFVKWATRNDKDSNSTTLEGENTVIDLKDFENLKKGKLYITAITRPKNSSAIMGDVEINEKNFPDKTFREYLREKYKGNVLTADDRMFISKRGDPGLVYSWRDIKGWQTGDNAISVLLPFGSNNLKGLELFDFGATGTINQIFIEIPAGVKLPVENIKGAFRNNSKGGILNVRITRDEKAENRIIDINGIENIDNLKYLGIEYDDNDKIIALDNTCNVEQVQIVRNKEWYRKNYKKIKKMKAPDISFIKKFPNLQALRIEGVMALDGKVFLDNEHLKELDIEGFASELDVSYLKNLHKLNIIGSYMAIYSNLGGILQHTEAKKAFQVKKIDISNNTNLREFILGNTYIGADTQEIDFGNNSQLKKLELFNVPLDNIKIDNLSGLESFIFEGNNKDKLIGPERIDFSKNIKLKKLHIVGSNIGNLDLKKNIKLESLDAYRNRLPYIEVAGLNNLSSFNIASEYGAHTTQPQRAKIKAKRIEGNKLVLDIGSAIGKHNIKNIYELQSGWKLDEERGYIEVPKWGMNVLRGSNKPNSDYRGFLRYLYKAEYGLTSHLYSNSMLVNLYLENQKPILKTKNKEIRIKQGQKFDPLLVEGINVTDVEDGYIPFTKDFVKSNKVNTKNPGEYEVIYQATDSWGEKSEPVTIKVIVEPASINDIYIKNMPEKVKYEEWDRLDLRGLVVGVKTNDGGEEEFQGYTIIENGIEISPNDGQELALGTEKVVLSHEISGKKTEFPISVTKPTLPKYELNVEGGIIIGGGRRFKKGEKVKISANIPLGKEFVGWEIKAGGQDVTIENSEMYTTTITTGEDTTIKAITRDFVAVKVEGIRVTRNPEKIEYFNGETLNLSNMEVELQKSDGIPELVKFRDFEKKGIGTSIAHGEELYEGDYYIKIFCKENNVSTSIKIKVLEKKDPNIFEGKLEINKENFPDDKFRSTLVKSLDKNSDGYITPKEAFVKGDISIKFSSDNFKGLDKIRFENIKRMVVNAPEGSRFPFGIFKDSMIDRSNEHGLIVIKSAKKGKGLPDLSELSQFKRLGTVKLAITQNDENFSLNDIYAKTIEAYIYDDGSKNKKMPYISIKENNKVNHLRIRCDNKLAGGGINCENLNSLRYIDAKGNVAENIKIDNCKKLNTISISGCGENGANLDIKDIPILEKLSLSDGKLSKLNLKDAENLKSIEFRNVTGIKNCALENKNISTLMFVDTDIESLDGIICKNLKELWINGAPIKKLNIKNMPNLAKVHLENTKISELDRLSKEGIFYEIIGLNALKFIDSDENEAMVGDVAVYNQTLLSTVDIYDRVNQDTEGKLKLIKEGGKSKLIFDMKEFLGSDNRLEHVEFSAKTYNRYKFIKDKGYVEIKDLDYIIERGMVYIQGYVHKDKKHVLVVHVNFKNHIPEIIEKDIHLFVGDSFNPYKDIKAEDVNGIFSLSKDNCKVSGAVNSNKVGTYYVSYKVTNSLGIESDEKTIRVIVEEPKVSEISISKKPKIDYIEDEKLSLQDLEVEIKKNNGDKETVKYADFNKKGLSVNLKDGEKANPSNNKLVITHEKTGVKAELRLKIKEKKPEWKQDKDGSWYVVEKGKRKKGWYEDKETYPGWYFFDKAGKMKTGWHYDESYKGWFYFANSGKMETGWIEVKGSWYYLENSGKMKTDWLELENTWYYLKSSGAMASSWEEVNGSWYYFENSGAMKTGWLQLGSTWYYLKSSGAMAIDWEKVNGTWYRFASSGAWIS